MSGSILYPCWSAGMKGLCCKVRSTKTQISQAAVHTEQSFQSAYISLDNSVAVQNVFQFSMKMYCGLLI